MSPDTSGIKITADSLMNKSNFTTFFRLLLRKEGYIFRTSSEMEVVRTLKERACYLSTNPLKEESIADADKSTYALPDGSSIDVGAARFRAPEVLFRPDLIGEECEGLHEVLVFAIQRSDLDLRKTLYNNIVLSGGSTLFKVSELVVIVWIVTINHIILRL